MDCGSPRQFDQWEPGHRLRGASFTDKKRDLDAGKASRINVGHFMADLITDDETWDRWKGKMPVLYNKATP